MNQNKITGIFIGVALLALVAAWEPWRRTQTGPTFADEVGTPLFPKFSDVLASASLDVVKFDESTASGNKFSIARVKQGVWSIPSHENYPADAKEHLADAGTALREVQILDVASTKKGDHELYGVVAPDPATLKRGAVGVGTQVTIKNAKGETLADAIIGKEVKERSEQRYVRRAGKDTVYKAKVTLDKFSTRFADWIEKDLLKLNALDVRQVRLNDYSSQPLPGGRIGLLKRSEMTLAYDDEKSNWNLVDAVAYEKNQPVSNKISDDEELNAEKLNNLRTAIDDLQIVDVARKPEGLSADLRASKDFSQNAEALQALEMAGYFPVGAEDGSIDILSQEGEVVCTLKDGVEYVLRFGVAASSRDEAPAKKEDAAADKADANDDEAKPKSDSKVNRFLMVSARFNDSVIPKPKLEPLPGEEPAAKPADEKLEDKSADDKAPAEPSKDAEPSDDKPADDKPEGDKPSDKEPADDKPADSAKPKSSEQVGKEAAQADAAADEEKEVDAKKADEAKADDSKAEDAKPDDKPADGAKPADDKTADNKPEDKKPDDKAAIDAKKAAIEQENKRKQKEYDDKIKQGQEQVKKLNERFADWYYIISDEVYQKIHLGRDNVVKKKAKPAAGKGDGIGDLKELEKGLEKEREE